MAETTDKKNGSNVITYVAAAAIAVVGITAYTGVGIYNLIQQLGVGVAKLRIDTKKVLLVDGLRIGVDLALNNPTRTSITLGHPNVDIGIINAKNEFVSYVKSISENWEYKINPQQATITKTIWFDIPPMTMLTILGDLNWKALAQAVLTKDPKKVMDLLRKSGIAIKPFFYVAGGVPVPLSPVKIV